MKFNFGTGLILFFAAWATGIIYLVTLCSNENEDLVTEDYYNKEVAYQSRIDDRENASHLSSPIELQFVKKENNVVIHFPEDLTASQVTGNIHFYKPDNALLDFNVAVAPKNLLQVVSAQKMKTGLWRVEISFNASGKNYFDEKNILVN